MSEFDIGICIPFLLALFFWSRGVWKQHKSDIALSVALFVGSVLVYARLYPVTSLAGVPWIFLLTCSLAAAAFGLRKRPRALSKKWFVTVAIVLPACLSVIFFAGERTLSGPANSLMVIAPYRHAGTWVFDDPRAGLQAEPFVSGIPELIDKLVADAGIENPDKGFRLLFSPQPFPAYQTKMIWRRQEWGGNWYYSEKYNTEGWLCPALFKYFRRAPKEIYAKAEARQASQEPDRTRPR